MTNKHRGEFAFTVGDETYALCLTLGALAEIETALGVDDLQQMAKRLRKPGAKHVIAILAALMRGGGHDIKDEDVSKMPIPMDEAMNALGAAMAASGMVDTAAAAGGGADSKN